MNQMMGLLALGAGAYAYDRIQKRSGNPGVPYVGAAFDAITASVTRIQAAVEDTVVENPHPSADEKDEAAAPSEPPIPEDESEKRSTGTRMLQEHHMRTINEDKQCIKGAANEQILEASCYSHSPPDLPLDIYNEYRRKEFDKAFLRLQLPEVLLKINARDKQFAKIHAKFPVDGPLESMGQVAKWQPHRDQSPGRYDPNCNCTNRGSCNQCLD